MKITCLSFLIVLFTTATYGQSMNKPSKYAPGDDVFFIENGFDIMNYQWDEPSINLHLSQALKEKKVGNIYLAGGLSTIGIGALVTLLGTLDQISNEGAGQGDKTINVGLGVMLTGGVFTILGWKSQKKKVRKHLRIANDLFSQQ